MRDHFLTQRHGDAETQRRGETSEITTMKTLLRLVSLALFLDQTGSAGYDSAISPTAAKGTIAGSVGGSVGDMFVVGPRKQVTTRGCSF